MTHDDDKPPKWEDSTRYNNPVASEIDFGIALVPNGAGERANWLARPLSGWYLVERYGGTQQFEELKVAIDGQRMVVRSEAYGWVSTGQLLDRQAGLTYSGGFQKDPVKKVGTFESGHHRMVWDGNVFRGRATFDYPPSKTDELVWRPSIAKEFPELFYLGEGRQGLTLYFNTRLTPFDRFLVDGVIFGVLGKETDCRVAQYEERGETAIIRLEAEKQEDLEAVANALWERVWEQQEKAQDVAVMMLARGIALQLQPGLSEVRDKLDHIELRLPSEAAVERLDGLGDDHVNAKDRKLVRTWGQKALSAVGKRVATELTEEGVDALKDAVKGLVPGGDEGEE